jgi:hypothetical protein
MATKIFSVLVAVLLGVIAGLVACLLAVHFSETPVEFIGSAAASFLGVTTLVITIEKALGLL